MSSAHYSRGPVPPTPKRHMPTRPETGGDRVDTGGARGHFTPKFGRPHVKAARPTRGFVIHEAPVAATIPYVARFYGPPPPPVPRVQFGPINRPSGYEEPEEEIVEEVVKPVNRKNEILESRHYDIQHNSKPIVHMPHGHQSMANSRLYCEKTVRNQIETMLQDNDTHYDVGGSVGGVARAIGYLKSRPAKYSTCYMHVSAPVMDASDHSRDMALKKYGTHALANIIHDGKSAIREPVTNKVNICFHYLRDCGCLNKYEALSQHVHLTGTHAAYYFKTADWMRLQTNTAFWSIMHTPDLDQPHVPDLTHSEYKWEQASGFKATLARCLGRDPLLFRPTAHAGTCYEHENLKPMLENGGFHIYRKDEAIESLTDFALKNVAKIALVASGLLAIIATSFSPKCNQLLFGGAPIQLMDEHGDTDEDSINKQNDRHIESLQLTPGGAILAHAGANGDNGRTHQTDDFDMVDPFGDVKTVNYVYRLRRKLVPKACLSSFRCNPFAAIAGHIFARCAIKVCEVIIGSYLPSNKFARTILVTEASRAGVVGERLTTSVHRFTVSTKYLPLVPNAPADQPADPIVTQAIISTLLNRKDKDYAETTRELNSVAGSAMNRYKINAKEVVKCMDVATSSVNDVHKAVARCSVRYTLKRDLITKFFTCVYNTLNFCGASLSPASLKWGLTSALTISVFTALYRKRKECTALVIMPLLQYASAWAMKHSSTVNTALEPLAPWVARVKTSHN